MENNTVSDQEVYVLDEKKEEESKEEQSAFDLLSRVNIEALENVQENIEQEDENNTYKIYKDIITSNTCLPSYDPSIISEINSDDDLTKTFEKRTDLSNAIFSLGVSNSDMDAVFSNGDTERYHNHTMFNNVKFYGDTVKIASSNNSDKFLDVLDQATGMAMPILIPLYNSGIWVALNTPDEPQIIALKYFAAEKEKQIGASTASTVYSNQSVLYMKTAVDLFMNLIAFTNVKCKKNELKDLILSSDINAMLNGLAQTMYLDGVNYYRTCSNYVSKEKPCGHSLKAIIRLQNALHVDFSKMSEAQLYHMAKKSPNSVSIDEVRAYQAEFKKNGMFNYKKEYILSSEHNIKALTEYSIPTLDQYLVQGEFWVNKLTKTASLIMSKLDKKDDFKKTGYSTQMKTDLLGSYLHYFHKITLFKNGENVSTSKSLGEISAAVERFSKQTILYDKILNDILEIIRNSTIAIVGIPEYECSNCKKMNTDTLPEQEHSFKKIIPFNVLQILFTLGDLRYQEIEERD